MRFCCSPDSVFPPRSCPPGDFLAAGLTPTPTPTPRDGLGDGEQFELGCPGDMLDRPAWMGDALADLFARTARGELRVVVGGAYPLARAREAQEALAGRRTTGKLVLTVGA